MVVFQRMDGSVQLANLLTDSWMLTELDLDPILGTGLALDEYYQVEEEDRAQLYYQNEDLYMASESLMLIELNSSSHYWLSIGYNISTIALGTPIAAAASYTNVSTGKVKWIEVLSLSKTGIEVSAWSGSLDNWLEYEIHPSVLSNSTGSARTYGSIAATAIGGAFAVVSEEGQKDVIEWAQVADDLVDWNMIGEVDVGYSWG